MSKQYELTDMIYMQRLTDILNALADLTVEMYQDPDKYDVMLPFLDEAQRMLEGTLDEMNYKIKHGND